jgi:hypothetical protein
LGIISADHANMSAVAGAAGKARLTSIITITRPDIPHIFIFIGMWLY